MKKYFTNPLLLDIRSLSAMRVAIALCLLIDLTIRSTDMVAHYTDQGLLPLELLFRFGWLPEYFSIYNFGNSPFWTAIIFGINFLLAILLLLGFRTRLVTVLCWVFIVSIHNRNNMIGQGGDDLLRLILFWGMFLPWGSYFSLDNIRYQNKFKEENTSFSIAGLGYILLVFSMYFFSALLKNGADWNVDFTALYYAYSLDMIVLPLGKWLLPYEQLLKVFTASAFYLELLSPLLLLIPWQVNWWRWVFIALIFGFHLCISTTLFVGLFPLISIATLLGLLPAAFWNKVFSLHFYLNINKKITATFNFIKLNHTVSESMGNTGFGGNKYITTTYNMVIGFLVGFCFYLNYLGVGSYQIDALEYMKPVAQLLRIDQRWGMFAPIVFRDDGWFVFQGTTADSTAIDIYNNGQKVNFAKPHAIVNMVKNDRWRKYQENILFVSNNAYRPYYCQWLMRQWNNETLPQKYIHHLQIIYMKEVTKPNYQKSIPSKEMLCECSF